LFEIFVFISFSKLFKRFSFFLTNLFPPNIHIAAGTYKKTRQCREIVKSFNQPNHMPCNSMAGAMAKTGGNALTV